MSAEQIEVYIRLVDHFVWGEEGGTHPKMINESQHSRLGCGVPTPKTSMLNLPQQFILTIKNFFIYYILRSKLHFLLFSSTHWSVRSFSSRQPQKNLSLGGLPLYRYLAKWTLVIQIFGRGSRCIISKRTWVR